MFEQESDWFKIEIVSRISAIIEYSREKTILYKWTREAYTDLTSMGREYIEPAKEMVDYRAMNDTELSIAIFNVVESYSKVSGKIYNMLNIDANVHCFKKGRFSGDKRCMQCDNCKTYKGIINHIQGKDLEHVSLSQMV